MKVLEDTAERPPGWMRVVFALAGVAFAWGCTEFVALDGGWRTLAAAVVMGGLAAVLVASAVTGRTPRWLWLLP